MNKVDTKERITTKEIRQYSKNVLSYYQKKLNDIDPNITIKLFCILFPSFLFNGVTYFIHWKGKKTAIIFINTTPFLLSNNGEKTLSFFYLHSVIAHELKHIQSTIEWQSGAVDNFSIASFLSFATRLCEKQGFSLDFLAQRFLVHKGRKELRMRAHAVSRIEIECYKYGFSEAFRLFSQKMSLEEHAHAETILESLSFIDQHLEIDYFSTRQAYNHFSYSIYRLQKILLSNPVSLKQYPQLMLFFNINGMLRSPVEIYKLRNEINTKLVDDFLARLFIALPIDWSPFFDSNPDFFDYISKLSNDYCAEAIEFMKNMPLGEVFLSKEILQDNAAMLIKNVNTLNQKMKEYHITHTAGSLFPLYYSDNFIRLPHNIN